MKVTKEMKQAFAWPYNEEAVSKEIKKDRRIGRKEAKLIHRLLKGRAR